MTPFESQYGNQGLDSLRLSSPQNVITPIDTLDYYTTPRSGTTAPSKFSTYGAPFLSGIQAGSGPMAPTTDIAEAGANVGASVLSGLIAGGMTGGPVGAALGGGGALLTSGVQAFFSVKNARKREREQKKLIKIAEEARKRAEEKQDAWNRVQHIQNLTEYQDNRNDVMFKRKWDTYTQKLGIMNNFASNNNVLQERLKSRFKD